MAPKRSSRILIGTASWSDPGFIEHRYPPKMPAGERLTWYARHFEMVEVNSTFYAIPERRMVERWCRSTPDGFVFDVKLHKLLSRHSATLKSLPPALQRAATSDAKGKVNLTPKIEQALLDEIVATAERCCSILEHYLFLLALRSEILVHSGARATRRSSLKAASVRFDGRFAGDIRFRANRRERSADSTALWKAD